MSLVLSDLGRVARVQGNYSKATEILEEARTHRQDLGHKSYLARTLIEMGSVARSQGDWERATDLHEGALTLFREMGDKSDIAFGLCNLGLTAFAQGNDRQAENQFEQALLISRETEAKDEAALALYGIGRVTQAQNHYASARAQYVEGITITRDQEFVAQHLEGLALLAIAENYLERAVRLFSASQALHPPFRFEMSARERDEHDQAIATVRAALGEGVFESEWEEGKNLTLEEAVKYALEENNH